MKNILIKNNTKVYITLSVFLILCILVLNTLLPSSSYKENLAKIHKEYSFNIFALENNPFVAIFFFLLFMLFLYGLINIFIFLYCIFNKKPFVVSNKPSLKFALGNHHASLLLFYSIYTYSLLYFISIALMIYKKEYNYSPHLSIIMNFIFQILIILIVIKNIPFSSLGVSLPKKEIIAVLRVYALTILLIVLINYIMIEIQERFHLFFTPQVAVYIMLILKDPFMLFILSIEIIFLGPISEELFFRGFIYNFLKKKLDWKSAVIITSIVFAFLHSSIWGFFIVFILSIGICYIYEKTRNIVSAIVFHSLYNTLSLVNILILKFFMK